MTEQTTEGQRLCRCGRPAVTPADEVTMCAEHRRMWDADAEFTAWRYAASILRPWVETTRAIGSDELTLVMQQALEEVEAQVETFRGDVERAKAALEA